MNHSPTSDPPPDLEQLIKLEQCLIRYLPLLKQIYRYHGSRKLRLMLKEVECLLAARTPSETRR